MSIGYGEYFISDELESATDIGGRATAVFGQEHLGYSPTAKAGNDRYPSANGRKFICEYQKMLLIDKYLSNRRDPQVAGEALNWSHRALTALDERSPVMKIRRDIDRGVGASSTT